MLSLYDRLLEDNIEVPPLNEWPLLVESRQKVMCKTMPTIMSSCSFSLWFLILSSELSKPQSQERWFLGGFWEIHCNSSNSLWNQGSMCECNGIFWDVSACVPCFYGQVTTAEVTFWFLGVIHRIVILQDLLVGLLMLPKISVERQGCCLCNLMCSRDIKILAFQQPVHLPCSTKLPDTLLFVSCGLFFFLFSMIYVFNDWLM